MKKALSIYFIIVFSAMAQTSTQKAPPAKAGKAQHSKSVGKEANLPRTGEEFTAMLQEEADELSTFTEGYKAVDMLRIGAWVVNMLATEPQDAVVDSAGVQLKGIPDTYQAKRRKLLDLLVLPPKTPQNEKIREKKLDDLREFIDQHDFVCSPRFADVPKACKFYLRNPIGMQTR